MSKKKECTNNSDNKFWNAIVCHLCDFTNNLFDCLYRIKLLYLKKYLNFKKNQEVSQQFSFKDLTSNNTNVHDHLDKIQSTYHDSLFWAITNKSVKNIALTGYYGTGKSTIIQKFTEKHKQFKYLNISLAKFKDDETFESDVEIEKSILQQIFYSEGQNVLKGTRFNRISNRKYISFKIIFFIFWLNVLLLFFEELFFKSSILSRLPLYEVDIEKPFFKYLLLIYFLVGLFIVFKKIYEFSSQIIISKITTSGVEIVPKNIKDTSSLLNINIDELIHFFYKSKVEIVFIEDLDRFKKPEIFVKLREIIKVINDSKDVRQSVKFVYAIKDEMFIDKYERTKFFDFIIPILPIINYDNSRQIFEIEISENELKNLIKLVSPFITDLRLLRNIINEYKIYTKIKEGEKITIQKEKILALIIYKNILPQDFTKLQKKEGILFNIFSNKGKITKKYSEKINEEINEIKKRGIQKNEELELLLANLIYKQFVQLADVKNNELNINHIIKQISLEQVNIQIEYTDKNYHETKTKEYNFYELIDDLKTNSILFQAYENGFFENLSAEKAELIELNTIKNFESFTLYEIINNKLSKFSDINIEKEFDEYFDKIVNDSELKIISQEIHETKIAINQITQKTPDSLDLSLKANSLNSPEKSQKNVLKDEKELLKILLKNGYVDETYLTWISYFHPGSLDIQEQNYLIKITDNSNIPIFDFKIKNIENFLEKTSDDLFKKPSILNFYIFKYLIENEDYRLLDVLDVIKYNSDQGLDFIKVFIFNFFDINGKQKIKLFRHLLTNNEKFCHEALLSKKLDKDQIIGILYFILKSIVNFDEGTIKKINYQNTLAIFISKHYEFLETIQSENNLTRIFDILKQLDVKFEKIELTSVLSNNFDFIVKNNLYEINLFNIQNILNYHKQSKKISFDLEKQNYTYILHSRLDNLIDYVFENIDGYLDKVLLKLDSNINESEVAILRVVNNANNLSSIENFLRIQTQKIEHVNSIENESLRELAIKYSKVSSTWNNVIEYYKIKDDVDLSLTSFLNTSDNYKELKKTKLSKYEFGDIKSKTNLCFDLICSDIDDNSFNNLIGSLDLYKFENLSEELESEFNNHRISKLISNDLIVVNELNLNYLAAKVEFKEFNRFVIKKINQSVLSAKLSELELNEKTCILILQSEIPNDLKISLLNRISTKISSFSRKSVNSVLAIILKEGFIIKDLDFAKNLIVFSTTSEYKVKLLIQLLRINGSLTNDIINELLIKIGGEYSRIAKKDRVKLHDNQTNSELLIILRDKGLISRINENKNNKLGVRY